MILINIEMLSDSELRIIAKQEGLENCETLSREDLIEELEELYEDNERPEDLQRVTTEKFTRTLTSTPFENVLQFPGTEPLPERYNKTTIHQVLRDANWAYVFWDLSLQVATEFEENPDMELLLRTRVAFENGRKENFDIKVSPMDQNWNIELPWAECAYKVQLVKKNSGADEILCETCYFSKSSSYFLTHASEVNDQKVKTLCFSPLVSRSGTYIYNNCIREIVEAAGEV